MTQTHEYGAAPRYAGSAPEPTKRPWMGDGGLRDTRLCTRTPPPAPKSMVSHVCYVIVRDLHDIAPEVSRIAAVNRLGGHSSPCNDASSGLWPIEVAQVLRPGQWTRAERAGDFSETPAYRWEFHVQCLLDTATFELLGRIPNASGLVLRDLNTSGEPSVVKSTISIPGSRGGMVYKDPKRRIHGTQPRRSLDDPEQPSAGQRMQGHSLKTQLAASILTSALHRLRAQPFCDGVFEEWTREFNGSVDIFDGAGRNCQMLKDWTKHRVMEMMGVGCDGRRRPPIPPERLHMALPRHPPQYAERYPPLPHASGGRFEPPTLRNMSSDTVPTPRTYETDTESRASSSRWSAASTSSITSATVDRLHSIAWETDFVKGPLPSDSARYTPSLLTPPRKVELLKWSPEAVVTVF
tara:strand:- start:21964 stop:23187 length:1224 start_codon:yes stop_codon:yes gene_type:complete